MRQLYEKSGIAARFSDFAIDVRKVVEADHLPEYALHFKRNEEGFDIVSMVRRSLLYQRDPRYELKRLRQRRVGGGISQKALTF